MTKSADHPVSKPSLRALASTAGLSIALIALPAAAVDGVREINQSAALAGSVTPGDAPGFPVTISEPGSYRLTGPLIAPDGTTTVILLAAGHIDLDLNGFAITCADPCLGNTGRGIDTVVEIGNFNSSVRNGRISGMGDNAISLLGLGVVEDMVLVGNGGRGIDAFDHMTVRNCTVTDNGGDGIHVSGGSRVEDNIVFRNDGDGIFAEFGSVLSGNSVADSTSAGLRCSSNCNFFRNTVQRNAVGIAGSGLARDNVIALNSGFGIDSANLVYSGNLFRGNNSSTGIQVGAGVDLGGNLCGSSTTCP